MGNLLEATKRLTNITDPDTWEEAVEAILIDMARTVEASASHLQTHRPALHLAHRDQPRLEQSGPEIIGVA